MNIDLPIASWIIILFFTVWGFFGVAWLMTWIYNKVMKKDFEGEEEEEK